jgi:hypothetical protein
MEKKGEIINQLAIISDLLENVNLESETTTVVFILEETIFNNMFEKVSKKTKIKSKELEDTFSVKIGEINFIFNKSSA